MEVFDLKEMEEKKAFYKADEFNARHIILDEGDEILPCDMSSYVIFTVLMGRVEVKVNDASVELEEGMCLVTEPATISMKADRKTKILGIQIEEEDG